MTHANGTRYLPVPGFPNYRVGDDGTVWTNKVNRYQLAGWRLRKPFRVAKGHLRIQLIGPDGIAANYYVHRLVLAAFVGPCPTGMEGCHNDGNPANNRLANLRWDTPSANQEDARRHGTMVVGSRSRQAKLTEPQVAQLRQMSGQGMGYKRIAAATGLPVSTVAYAVRGQTWKHVPA